MAKSSKNNGKNSTQENLGFDVDAWKEMGLQQINMLNDQIGEKDAAKRKIDEEIAVLVDQRTIIEKALGVYKGRKSGGKRVQIKPVLLQVFVENEGKTMDFDTIVEKVQAEQPKANEKKIRGAFERFVKNDSRIYTSSDGWKFVSVGD